MLTSPTGALPLKKRALRGRRLVVVDIEDMIGGIAVTERTARWANGIVQSAAELRPTEHVIVSTNRSAIFQVHTTWPSARIITSHTPHSPCAGLVAVLATERIDERFDEVAIISGNRMFAEAAASLGELGVRVTVTSWASGLAPQLRIAAARVDYLDDWVTAHKAKETA